MLPGRVHGSFCASAIVQQYNVCLQHRHAIVVERRWVRQQGKKYRCDLIEKRPYVECSLFAPASKRRHSVTTRKGMEHGKHVPFRNQVLWRCHVQECTSGVCQCRTRPRFRCLQGTEQSTLPGREHLCPQYAT